MRPSDISKLLNEPLLKDGIKSSRIFLSRKRFGANNKSYSMPRHSKRSEALYLRASLTAVSENGVVVTEDFDARLRLGPLDDF